MYIQRLLLVNGPTSFNHSSESMVCMLLLTMNILTSHSSLRQSSIACLHTHVIGTSIRDVLGPRLIFLRT